MNCRLSAALAIAVVLVGCGDSEAPSDMAAVVDMTVPIDMMKLPAECDVFANSGCAAGQKCTIGTQNGTPRDLCFAIAANPVGEGAPCMSLGDAARTGDDCAPGLICLDFPGDGPHCRKPCYVRSECPSGQGCVLTTPTSTQRQSEGGVDILHACIADTGCDPVAQTVCSGGRGCWLSPPDDVGRVGICLMNLAPGMAGADCKAQAECAPGFRCQSLGFCRRYCYYDTTPDGGATAGLGACPAAEGVCDRFAFSGPLYGICGAE